MIRPTELKLAVIGDPVAHSASPALHRRFLEEARLAGTYEAIRIGAGEGARGIAALRQAGYTGLNVTTPLKEEAFACADDRDPAARASGAVNTLVLKQNRIVGYNTDGIGAVGALRDAGLGELGGSRILVVGAGATARAAVAALVTGGCMTSAWNRTRSKADAIVAELGAHAFTPREHIDAVLSTLPPGVAPDRDLWTVLLAAPLLIDANYGSRATLGALLGREVHDGSRMLAASARASFHLFCSVLAGSLSG